MRVLLTGATGFVGQHVVPHLLKRGHEVVAVAREEAKARTYPWFDRVRFIASDLHRLPANPADFFGLPDAVIHLAWPGLPNYKSLFHFEDNLPADYRFLKSLVLGGARQVMVTGTCFEYGMQSGPLKEHLPAIPTNPYGMAKDTLRQFLENLGREHPFVLQWARLFYMYGAGQNPKSLLAQLDAAIDRGESEFPMSGGEQLRDYLPVETVAHHLVTLLENPCLQGITNICSGIPISVRRLVEEHMERRGVKLSLRLGHYPYPDYEPMAFWGDRSKLQTILEAE